MCVKTMIGTGVFRVCQDILSAIAAFSSEVLQGHLVYPDCLENPDYLELKESLGSVAQLDHVDCLDCPELKEILDTRENPGIMGSRECREFPVRKAIREREV